MVANNAELPRAIGNPKAVVLTEHIKLRSGWIYECTEYWSDRDSRDQYWRFELSTSWKQPESKQPDRYCVVNIMPGLSGTILSGEPYYLLRICFDSSSVLSPRILKQIVALRVKEDWIRAWMSDPLSFCHTLAREIERKLDI